MINIKIVDFNSQVKRLSDNGNDYAQAFIQTFDLKLFLSDLIINTAIDRILKNITQLYRRDSEAYKILNDDKGMYDLQVTDIKKDDSENKADNYLGFVEAIGKGVIKGALSLSPYSTASKLRFICTWKHLTYLCRDIRAKEIPLLPDPSTGNIYYYCTD